MAVSPTTSGTLIADRYAIDLSRPMPGVGGGLTAYAVTDLPSGDARLVALAVGRHAGPRAAAMRALDVPIDNLMGPLAHGIAPRPGGGQGYYVVCHAPPGAALSAALTPWAETPLLEYVLRPAARVLTALQDNGVTHRAIRPDNVFLGARNQPVTLGAAWAAPPAMHQPAVFEAPFSAMCHPAARGEGTIADDVYSLGVLLLVLSTGQLPMAGLDDATVVTRKLDLGSFTALTGGSSLPPFLSDLLRGMLAEDPEQRSQPRLLMDPANARSRRLAARPPRRSQRPLMLNDLAVFDARMLAYALSTDAKKAAQALRNGIVSQWLRRGLGDASLASVIEDLSRVRMAEARPGADADPELLMQVISTLEPNMPLCWREIALWPDAIGSLLAEGFRSAPSLTLTAEELLKNDTMSLWASSGGSRRGRDAAEPESAATRQMRVFLRGNDEGGLLRAFYVLNPLLPCALPAMAEVWIIGIPDLMQFLEKAAGAGQTAALMDPHLRAFIAARGDRQVEISGQSGDRQPRRESGSQAAACVAAGPADAPLSGPDARLGGLVARQLRPDLDEWQNQPRRAALIERLDVLVQGGSLARLLALVDDARGLAEDVAGAQRAAMQVMAIDGELAALARSGEERRLVSARFGREIAAAIGLTALILMMLSAIF